MGLFGCLAFYDHITSNAMLTLHSAVKLTKLLRTMRVRGGGRGRGAVCGGGGAG